ncbi:hypothetical protein KBY58_01955 [Cyanobium sp. HWJ4-Hawea]|uniref:hypothetical protein n=1 Tax=unclassified Cyanobium TaxID=2627006 RepID=UPI0020CE8B18|nr:MULTISPECIES: hypothetical protein [unclassified Cyanobium]MCP9775446.1 hypothetical protein [Cyanobium sp. WAJ14-Wanaka]MCP9808196.1 hypothetical protein [Cyanobium sp. HWJ4-Hawea]
MGYREEIASGRVAFAHLIRVWHERNGWSHRVLPALAEALDLGRVHNSQLSMLRNGKLASPGPELFLALGRINQLLAQQVQGGQVGADLRQRLSDHPELVAALEISALPVQGEGEPVLGPGQLMEIFVGLSQPPAAFDLRIAESEAAPLSAALALLFTAGRPWRQCREQLLAAYPVEKRQRRDRFAAVMAGQSDYSAAELDCELPDLRRTLAALGAAGEGELEADQFLDLLRHKASDWQQGPGAPGSGDLGAAIRQQMARF